MSQPPQQPQQSSQSSQQPRAPSTAPSQRSVDQFDGQRSQQPSTDRPEDPFPPLGGQLHGNGLDHPNGLGGNVASSDSAQQPHTNGQQTQLPLRQASIAQSQQAPIGSGQPALPSQQQTPAQTNGQPANPSVKRWADMSDSERYGLVGVQAALEARRALDAGQPVDETLPAAMRNGFFFGQDLSTIGMDLDSPDPLYPTFTPFPIERANGSMFDFMERNVVPEFNLPSAYTVTNVPPLEGRMGVFSEGEHRLNANPRRMHANETDRNPLLPLLPTPRRPETGTRRHRTHKPRMALAQDPPPMVTKRHPRPLFLFLPPNSRHGLFPPCRCAAGTTRRPNGERRVCVLRRDELAATETGVRAGLCGTRS